MSNTYQDEEGNTQWGSRVTKERQSQDCYNLHCLSKGENDNVICAKEHRISLTLKQALEGLLDPTCKDCPDYND